MWQGQFTPIKGNYSTEFRELVSLMLQHDHDLRPSAYDILYTHLPQVNLILMDLFLL